jgi:hypothetical protein
MADKVKQEHFSQQRQRELESALSKKITGEPRPLMEDDNFARRAGEIIARAVGTLTNRRRRGK